MGEAAIKSHYKIEQSSQELADLKIKLDEKV